MGFTTPCFIRKNTPKLRKKLEKLGYRLFGEELNEDLCIFTSPECGLYNIEFFSNIPHPEETDSIDCGTNEELFLAIAALRDDTDKNQCFTDGNLWFKCGDEMCDETIKYYLNRYNREIHKASIEELMEHFKGKEE
jgi:hypothetical protein